MKRMRGARVAGTALTVALVVAGAAACEDDKGGAAAEAKAGGSGTAAAPAPSKAPAVLAPAGYRGLALGMAKDAALATGELETAPVSLLQGCTDFVWKGGPAPDAARMATEAAADARNKELDAKVEALAKQGGAELPPLPPNASAKQSKEFAEKAAASAAQSAANAKVYAESAQAIADRAVLRDARDKAFAATGRVSFGAGGLRELAVPADARTAEGIGAGSTVEQLKAAYGAKGLEPNKSGTFYRVPVEGGATRQYEFRVEGDKVTTVALTDPAVKCGA